MDGGTPPRPEGQRAALERERIDFEAETRRRCIAEADEIVQRYRELAQDAIAQAAATRREAQEEALAALQREQADRARWAAAVAARSEQLVAEARAEAAQARQDLARERQRFALLEAEVRRQFEEHCRVVAASFSPPASPAFASPPSNAYAALPPPPPLPLPPGPPPASRPPRLSIGVGAPGEDKKVQQAVGDLRSFMHQLRADKGRAVDHAVASRVGSTGLR